MKKEFLKLILPFLFVLIVVFIGYEVFDYSLVNEKDVQLYKDNIKSDSGINKYIDGDIELEKIDSYSGIVTVKKYVFNIPVNSNFVDLSKDEKYYIMIDVIKILKKTKDKSIPGTSDFECGSNKNCYLEGINFVHKNDTYSMMEYDNENDSFYHYQMEVNSKVMYRPEKENEKISASSDEYSEKNSNTDNETETTVDNKDGNDWLSLNDNEKFHAVSNALYNLEQEGYIITQSEYYYIDALEEFYSDSSTTSTSISMALALIGEMSGTITR